MITIFSLDAENEGVRVLRIDFHLSPLEVIRESVSVTKLGKGCVYMYMILAVRHWYKVYVSR